jgi:hypothetical protein
MTEIVDLPQKLPEDVSLDTYLFTEKNYSIRTQAMTIRLQVSIIKMFGWQMVPDYDIYIWTDIDFRMIRDDSIAWLLDHLGSDDIVFFRHPKRSTIREEAEFLRYNVPRKEELKSRYNRELLEEQMQAIPESDKDAFLLASGIYAYRNNDRIHRFMKEWWYHTSRFHINNQLSLPYVLKTSDCTYSIIADDIYHCKHFGFYRVK